MPCYTPLDGWLASARSKNGKRAVTFKKGEALVDRPISVPCGQCIGCRLEKSREWAVRCVHEASQFENNCFVTLTYADPPDDWSVDVRELQLFFKKLRKKYGAGIRYFACGEYGEKNGRPHYHAIIFNHDWKDKILWKTENENPLYTSQSLSELWGQGFCSTAAVTFQSAAYVARYCTKKITGKNASPVWFHPETGELQNRKSEFGIMSRRPGIGATWLEKYGPNDVLPHDHVVHDGTVMGVPRYYRERLAALDPSKIAKDRSSRVRKARSHPENNTSGRLKVRETVKKAQISHLPRKLEKEK